MILPAAHRQVRPTLPSWRPLVALLCGVLALAGLLSSPVTAATPDAGAGACLLTPGPDAPDAPGDGGVEAKKPRRIALPALQRMQIPAPAARCAAVSPALPNDPAPAIAGTVVPHAIAPAPALPPARSGHSRGPPAAA